MALAIAETHEPLRPRNISGPSSRPTQQGGCTFAVRQGASGSGEGQHTASWCDHRRMERSRSGCPSNRRGLRGHGLGAPGRSLTPRTKHGRALFAGAPRAQPVRPQAHPLRALRLEKLGHIEGLWACEPGIDGTPQLLGQESQRVALAGCFLHSGQVCLAGGIVPEQEPRRCREGPRQGRVADLGPCGPGACARRCFGTRDEAARGDAILHAGKPLESVARLQQDAAQDCPDAGHRLEQIQGVGGVLLRCFDARPLERAQPRRIVPKQRQVHGHALVHGGRREALGAPVAVGCVGQLFPDLGPGRLAVRILEVRQQCRPFPGERPPAPAEVTGGAHVGGRDSGLRQQAPAEPHGNLVGVDRVVFGLAAMDGLHRARVPEDNRDPVLRTQGSEPVPGAEAFDSHASLFPGGRDGLEQRLGTGLHVPVQPELARLVQDTDVHAAGVEVHTAVTWVLGGVESPEVSSS